MENFNFAVPADVYVSDRRGRKSPLRYLRFDRSADAVRHVMEHEDGDAVVTIETDQARAERRDIRDLYLSRDYPLERGLNAARVEKPAHHD